MLLNDIRNYEVSIWTLQDSFITVLKYANLENKGQIQDPDFNIVDDGTLQFKFKIPMYLNINGKKTENPNWYNITNGIIIADMRKIKVIINKKDSIRESNKQQQIGQQAIYEFIITNVEEVHDTESLYCEVTCQGLAFHELGKVGYKLFLTNEDFYNEDLEWFKTPQDERETEQPRATLQYWNDKVFKTLKHWSYEIQMDWSGYQTGDIVRDSHKVYEDSYVSAWKYDEETGTLLPKQVQVSKEKERLVDLKESNVYNITQSLAEIFGVFCKYVYEHDDNYHIIGRKVIYYNNFLNQKLGALDITYPYTTSSVSRRMDATDVVTKLYVKPITSESNSNEYITIMNTPANKSGEDYLLNFDYLHNIGAITQQQYQQINNYENKMAYYNSKMIPLESEIINLQQEKVQTDANVTIFKNAIGLDDERITASDRLLNAITNDTGLLHVTFQKPATGVLLSDSSTEDTSDYYLKLSQNGILPQTLRIYRTYHYTALGEDRLQDEIFGVLQYDQFNNLTKITKLYPYNVDGTLKRTVYLTYDYSPSLYYENIKKAWAIRLEADTKAYNDALIKQQKINEALEEKQNLYKSYADKKAELAHQFTTMMGPALREGYWMPDDYNDYGDKFTSSFSNGFDCGTQIQELDENNHLVPVLDAFGNKTYQYSKTDIHGYATPIWDTIPFDGQQLSYYESGVQQERIYYPCIRLTKQQLEYIQTHENASLIFYDLTMNQTMANIRSFSIGSQCQIGFLKEKKTLSNGTNTDVVFPVLFITGADTFSQTQLKTMMSSGEKVNYSASSISKTTSISKETRQTVDMATNNNITTNIVTTIEKNSKGTIINSKKVSETESRGSDGTITKTSEIVEEDQLGKVTTTRTNAEGLVTTIIKYSQTTKDLTNPQQVVVSVKNVTETTTEKKRTINNNTETIEADIQAIITTTIGGQPMAPQIINSQKLVTIKTTRSVGSNGNITTTVTKTIKITNIKSGAVQNTTEKNITVTNSNGQVIKVTDQNSQGTTIIQYNGNQIKTTKKDASGATIFTEQATATSSTHQEIDEYGNSTTTTIQVKTILQDDKNTTITTTTVQTEYGKKVTTETVTLSRAEYNTCARLGILTHVYRDGATQIETNEQPGSVLIAPKYTLTIDNSINATYTPISNNNNWIDASLYQTVYPRIKINSLALKDSSDQFAIVYNDKNLVKYEDYSILTRLSAYYINFKNINILEGQTYLDGILINTHAPYLDGNGNIVIPTLKVYYCLSNADTAIYLDAIQVQKQNAFPKVSYDIKVNIINLDFIKNIYNKLGYIAHINDNDLKFENVLGYISEIHLNFDDPSKDEIKIKNYKTKFEDLFTKIVASTEEMKKNSYVIGLAAQAFNVNGDINSAVFNSSFSKVDLNYAFNNGKLTINQKDGIWGTSESGVVAYRGGGIFTATAKDESGNWIWNTGITPEGINADLITAGQIDTSKIKVYAGDRLRFQLNGDGLFAYKSFIEDFDIVSSEATDAVQDLQTYLSQETDGYTKAEYVKFTENGLFLVAENGTHIYDKNNHQYRTLSTLEPVTRVQVSWSGFKLRNWSNQEVFYADPDTGNLTLQQITAKSGIIGGFTIADDYLATGNKTSFRDLTQDGVFLGEEGISLGKGLFSVTRTGQVNAVSGIIGGWNLASNMLYSVPVDNEGNKIWSSGIVLNASGNQTENTYAIWAGAETPEGGTTSTTYHVVDQSGKPVYVNGIVRQSDGNFSRTYLTDDDGNVIYHSVTKDSSGNITGINGKPFTDTNWGQAADGSYKYYITQKDSTTNEILSCYIYLMNNGTIITEQQSGSEVVQVYQSIPGQVQKTVTVDGIAAPAPFRLKRDGKLYVNQLYANEIYGTAITQHVDAQGHVTNEITYTSLGSLSSNIERLNRMGLKATVYSNGKVILEYVEGGSAVVNFNSAGSVRVTSWGWSGNAIRATLSNQKSFTSGAMVHSVTPTTIYSYKSYTLGNSITIAGSPQNGLYKKDGDNYILQDGAWYHAASASSGTTYYTVQETTHSETVTVSGDYYTKS